MRSIYTVFKMKHIYAQQKPISFLKFIVYLGFENQPLLKYSTEKSSERKKPSQDITVIKIWIWVHRHNFLSHRYYHAATPPLSSIWSKCQTPAIPTVKVNYFNFFHQVYLNYEKCFGTSNKLPCPLPILLNWATYSDIFLMSST